jgi:hypothetical protein
MSVVGLRLTHAMFALAVLAVWYALQRDTQVLFEVATFSGADAGERCPGNL